MAAETIRIGIGEPVARLSNATPDGPGRRVLPFLFNAVYRLDANLAPVPDLAAEPCEVSTDGLTWTCALREARFHDGSPMTSEDVAFTFQLARSNRCPFPTGFRQDACLAELLEVVDAIGERTIRFSLSEAYAPFATRVLPGIFIESKRAIEAAFGTVADSVSALDPTEISRVLDLFDPSADQPGDCLGFADEAETVFADINGLVLPDRGETVSSDPASHEFDACTYASTVHPALVAVELASRERGVDAIAAAYPFLATQNQPIGTGAWSCPAGCANDDSIRLEAFDEHYAGPPQTRTLEIRTYGSSDEAAEDLSDGMIDWVPESPRVTPAGIHISDAEGISVAEYSDLAYMSLQYNLREGQLFADREARLAVQRCIDKPEIVEHATHGLGVPVESYVPPDTWAHHTDLPTIERDTAAGMELLREAGWHVEDTDDDGVADSVATRAGRPFRTAVLVRAGQPERLEFMEGVAAQVADCGMELEVFEGIHAPLFVLLTWPHIPPNETEPWHAYFGGWSTGADPDAYDIWHSTQCTSEEQPESWNYICFDDPRADRLIEEGRRTVDVEERAPIYRELQELMYAEQPHLFAFTMLTLDAFDSRLRSSAGELDLSSPRWDWQPETLYIGE